jgi:hypothetical protein
MQQQEEQKTVSKYTPSHLIRFFVLIVSIAFIGADVSAQNSNSSPTTGDTTMQNTNMSTTNTNSGRRGRRRGRRGGRTITPSGTAMEVTLQPGDEIVTDRPVQAPVQTGRCDPMAQEQTDLSGTYTGTANYSEGGLMGEATLTITGNDFTITSGSTTQEGRITAVTTCNYTGVTMMFGKPQVSATTGAQPAPLPAVSLRARKVGNGLTLESVGGEARQFSFSSAGAVGGGSGNRPRARRGRRPTRAMPVGIKPPTAMEHAH